MSTYNFQDMLSPENTGSGIADHFLYAPLSSFIDIKKPGTTSGQTTVITGSHTFKSTEGFIKVMCQPFINELKLTPIGEPGSGGLMHTLDVFVPGMYPLLNEFVKNTLNQPAIILIPECNDEESYYQLGSPDVFSWLTVNGGTGTTKEGKKGWALTFQYPSTTLWIYKGTPYLKATDYGGILSWNADGNGDSINYSTNNENLVYE